MARGASSQIRNQFQSARHAALALFALTLSACGGTRSDYTPPPYQPPAAEIDFAVTHQTIAGFGASSAWTLPAASDEQADQFFSTEAGIGLSLLRLRIAPNGFTSELVTAQKAVARGARVWAAPWSPPGAWKDNGSDSNGGRLLPEHRGDWAKRLVNFVVNLEQQGVPLLYLSAQNEPNWVASWETCEWTPAELTAFVRDELGPRLVASGVATRILAPETNDWGQLSNFGDALLGDDAASSFIGPLATHSYGGTGFDYPGFKRVERELWETEWSDDSARDAGMTSALRVATKIHQHLVGANVSAWHYWWLVPRDDIAGNSALTDAGELTRRAYVLGNFSRFVRPGFVRVKTFAAPVRGVSVSAFRDPESSRLAVVVINENANETPLDLVLENASPTSLVPFVTSEAAALEEGAALEPNPNAAGRFNAVLAARSVTTFTAF